MREIIDILRYIVENFILVYAIVIILSYIILAVISLFVLRSYLRRNSYIDYEVVLSSQLSPSISVIAPAYNEGKTIIDNVRALLSLFYQDFEVIIINDGSTDDSLEIVIEAYDLEKIDYAVNYKIPTEEVIGVYKSRNQSFSNLIVIDKFNGGKADALNAGLNISSNDYFVSIDVDSIVAHDALLKLAKPFLEEKERRIIATGGVIRIANSCEIEGGQLIRVRAPKQILPKFQVLEYTRSFLMGRMAWSRLNGLLVISGALGLFDREIAIKCGGYYAKTVGEDMELVVRMRKYMSDNRLKYKVSFVPDPLCWTEVPSSVRQLGRQRNRWVRGTIDTLWMHKEIFLNPKYGLMGLLSYPYWFFFEWLAPIFELIGFVYFILVILLEDPDWIYLLVMLGFIYVFAVTFSTYALLFEEMTFHKYEKRSDVAKLLLYAWLEPIIYHPLILWWGIKGNYDYFIARKRGWGEMQRKGFQHKTYEDKDGPDRDDSENGSSYRIA